MGTIMGPMKVNSITHKTVLDLDKLEPEVRGKVEALEHALYSHTAGIAKSVLGIGKTLTELQEVLGPMQLFTYYLNRLAWLSTPTAYRYIAAYKRAKQLLPEAVVEKAIVAGMPLFSIDDKKPYGKYTEVLGLLPEPPSDEKGAEQWLYALRLKMKEVGHTPKRENGDRIVTVLARAYLKDPKGTVREWLRGLERRVTALVHKRQHHHQEAA